MLAGDRPGYGSWTRARLRAIKAEWDPDNVFRSNHNVVPLR
jgi:FAD/FMN-containing dehydrogenase